MAYTGSSIVDYLKSTGQASDFGARSQLAAQKGIQSYAGTPEQNTQLLGLLRATTPAPQPTTQPTAQPTQPQIQQPATGLGSVAETNRLLQTASPQTGVPAPTFAPSGATQPTQVVQPPQQPTQPVQELTPAPTPPQETLPTTEELIQQYLDRDQQSPSATFEDIYNKVSEKLNLASDKAGIETSAKEIEKLQNELADKVSEVNSNPWLSEGKRQKSIELLQEKYRTRENTLINRLRLQESVYNRNAENARFAATQAFDFVQQQQTGERQQAQLEQNQFQFLIEQAQKVQEAKRKLSEIEPGRYKEVQGGLYDVKEGKFIIEPKATGGTGIVGEYTFYAEQEKAAGRKPVSFNEYQNIDANRKKSIAAAGVQKPLSGEAAKVYAIATTIIPEIEQLKDAFRSDYKRAVTGIVTGSDRRLVKLVDQVADKVGRLRSGGAVNKEEEARFKKQIASLGDIAFGKSTDAISALDGLITEARSVSGDIRPGSKITTPPGQTYKGYNLPY